MTLLTLKVQRRQYLHHVSVTLLLIAAGLLSAEIVGCIGPRLAAAMLFLVAIAGLIATALRRFGDERTTNHARTVEKLLEFTQSIHGAGQPRQVHEALVLSLQSELNLAGLITLGTGGETAELEIVAEFPQGACNAESIGEMQQSACPCLRQNLPKEFKPSCTPVRCAVDRALQMGSEHSAYCLPMTIGVHGRYLIHMLLPPGVEWTDPRKQLASAYVNAACSALMSLHLLQDAQRRSVTDPLTQLYNRLSMEQMLGREVALAERHNLPFSLVMLDLDKFKRINDTHGHAAGDHLLKALADCIRMTLRKTDLAFRLGGDEFVIALPQTTVGQAKRVVEKLRQAFGSVDFSSAVTHLDEPPTLSIGLVERDRAFHLVTLPALLAAADQALYEAKRNDRNCVRVYAAAA